MVSTRIHSLFLVAPCPEAYRMSACDGKVFLKFITLALALVVLYPTNGEIKQRRIKQ
jgi:hypothetical protein